jgi:integrase
VQHWRGGGTARAVFAVETGLRSNELRSLTRASFAIGTEATVTVEVAYSKHRREDTQSLRPALGGFLAIKTPDVRPAAMFRADVEAAGIPYRDAAGHVADSHALRHTFITNLANAGVHPKTAQTLARHCSITLTMDLYSHTLRGQEAEALAVLPDLSQPTPHELKATGTTHTAAPSLKVGPHSKTPWRPAWRFRMAYRRLSLTPMD